MLAPPAALRSQIVPGETNPTTDSAIQDDEPPPASSRAWMRWAQLLKRVFALDLTTCSHGGGLLTILTAIDDPAMILKMLTHLGLPSRAPPTASSRLDTFRQTA